MPVRLIPDTGDPELDPGMGSPRWSSSLAGVLAGRGWLPSRRGRIPAVPRIWAGALLGLCVWGLRLSRQGFPEEGRGGGVVAEGTATWWRSLGGLTAEQHSACVRPPPGVQVVCGPHLAWQTGRKQRPGVGRQDGRPGDRTLGRPPACRNRTSARHQARGALGAVSGLEASHTLLVSRPLCLLVDALVTFARFYFLFLFSFFHAFF